MQYNFVEYIKNINLYAILDAIFLAIALVLFVMFFVYKRNLKVLVVVLSVFVLDILVIVLSELYKFEILTVSRYILHFATLMTLIMCGVVYQNDLKSIFQKFASSKSRMRGDKNINSEDELRDATAEILTACQNMAKQDVGAIIIIDTTGDIHDNILETGTRLDAKLSAPLFESIFNTKAPLHDGAVIVRGNRIIAAGCFLTLTQRNVNKEMGTRHRAAIGITEDTNVMSIVVSEETGIISVVKHGEIRRYMTMDKLKDEIEETYGVSSMAIASKQTQKEKKRRGR
ncbi:MAG: diadenylate cyclase [Clostridia bacterium]